MIMSTGIKHYREAERLLADESLEYASRALHAQVHATLALTAATATVNENEDEPMGPAQALQIVSAAIPEELRGEDVDAAMNVLYALAKAAANASNSL
jgi:hypothetical protein